MFAIDNGIWIGFFPGKSILISLIGVFSGQSKTSSEYKPSERSK